MNIADSAYGVENWQMTLNTKYSLILPGHKSIQAKSFQSKAPKQINNTIPKKVHSMTGNQRVW